MSRNIARFFHFSLEFEFNALHFINYTIPWLCSTYAVATITMHVNLRWINTIVILHIWLFISTDIPYKGDFHKILEMVFVRYVLFKGELILKTVAIFVQKAGLIGNKVAFH